MTTAIRKATVLAVLTAYVLAGTLMQRFHDHSPGGGCPRVCACAEAAEHCGGEHGSDEHDSTACGLLAESSGLTSAHDCAVCVFLAQKPAPAQAVDEVTVTLLVASVSRVATVGRIASPSGPQHPRAPPFFA